MSNQKEILIKEINEIVEKQNQLKGLGFVSLCLKNNWPMPDVWNIEKLKELKERLEKENE